MITILSPSKSMDLTATSDRLFTQPDFLEQSEKLVAILRTFSTDELMTFMAISEPLAKLNKERFSTWARPFTLDNAKQALLAFTGDVYDGLDASSLSPNDLDFAQDHLRILSGLYGLLRPLDLIQPYRLEMGRALKTSAATTLTQLWRDRITQKLNGLNGEALLNLASQEYFNAINPRALNKPIVSPVFKDEKNGAYKIISFFAKKARGAMARYVVENRLTRPEELLAFTATGYRYAPELSTDAAPVFLRSKTARA